MRGPSPAPAAQYSKMSPEASEIVSRTNLAFSLYIEYAPGFERALLDLDQSHE